MTSCQMPCKQQNTIVKYLKFWIKKTTTNNNKTTMNSIAREILFQK